MPQFDFSTYSSQIFWFSICFGFLFLMLKVVLVPRIRDILQQRKSLIENDLALGESLKAKIEDLNLEVENLRQNVTLDYQKKIEDASKNASLHRENLLLDAKNKIEETAKKSRSEIENFIQSTSSQRAEVAAAVAKMIEAKILNS